MLGFCPEVNLVLLAAFVVGGHLIAADRGWSKMEAYRLVSVACDVRVTELVDGSVGVHVMIPKSILAARGQR